MTRQDREWLGQALALAHSGYALASPNPSVGAVVVAADGTKAGEGFHAYDGRKHAEVLALEQAGPAARGATLYVSLEPCSIQGRTPPCVDAILGSGIRRVVVAARDRNPAVDGSGLALLRQNGLRVEEADGELAATAQRLNQAFFHFARTRQPLVTLKTALTLDGKIAAPDDNTGWITSGKAREHVQQVRHRQDAIMTGIGTVHADDCLLTDRTGRPRRRPLLRVITDSLLRIPLNSRIVESAQDDLVVATTSAATQEKRKPLLERDITVQNFDSPNGRVDLLALLDWLGERQVTSLMVEGGAKLNWAVLEAGIVNKVLLYFAPKILGGLESLPMVGGAGRRSRSGAIRLQNLRTIGVAVDEFAVEADVVSEASEPRR